MFALALSAAFAAPAGWNVTDAKADGGACELSLGPAEADGVVPMRAECVWPDVTLDKFKAAQALWDKHDDYFSSVVESSIQAATGASAAAGQSLVHQQHHSSGISDREVLLWMWHETTSDGYERYAWKTASEQALTPASGNVRCDKSEGYWQAKAEGTGVRVIHVLSYDPGGSVPGFLVRWFQTSGLEANASELHQALRDGTKF